MMPRYRDVVDVSTAMAKLDKLPEGVKQKVRRYALSDITRAAGSDVTTAIGGTYNIKPSKMEIKTGIRKGAGFIRANTRERNLEAFKGTKHIEGKGGGISYEFKIGDRKFQPGGFFAKSRRGMMNKGKGVLVFKRVAGAARYPIKSLYALSIGNLLKSTWIKGVIDNSIVTNASIIIRDKVKSFSDK